MSCVFQGIIQFYLQVTAIRTCLYWPAAEHHRRDHCNVRLKIKRSRIYTVTLLIERKQYCTLILLALRESTEE